MINQVELFAIQSSLQLLSEHEEQVGIDQIKDWLESKVYDLLNNNFSKLLSVLYRIDVSEAKAKECFGKENKDIAKCLANLIWERQLEKAKTRFAP